MENEMTNDAAVAWLVTNGGKSCEPWLVWELSEVKALPSSCIADPLYSATTVAELRAEVERLRESNELYSFAMNTAGIDELKRRADAAERRVADALAEIDKSIKWREYECEELRNAAIKVSTHFENLRIHEICIRALNDARKALTKESP